MNKIATKALNDSIKVWEKKLEVVKANKGNVPSESRDDYDYAFSFGSKGKEIVHLGQERCPLCKKFYNDGDCIECPIKKVTKCANCGRTPYWKIEDAFFHYAYANKPVDNKLIKLVKKEVDFLKSLKPKRKIIKCQSKKKT